MTLFSIWNSVTLATCVFVFIISSILVIWCIAIFEYQLYVRHPYSPFLNIILESGETFWQFAQVQYEVNIFLISLVTVGSKEINKLCFITHSIMSLFRRIVVYGLCFFSYLISQFYSSDYWYTLKYMNTPNFLKKIELQEISST